MSSSTRSVRGLKREATTGSGHTEPIMAAPYTLPQTTTATATTNSVGPSDPAGWDFYWMVNHTDQPVPPSTLSSVGNATIAADTLLDLGLMGNPTTCAVNENMTSEHFVDLYDLLSSSPRPYRPHASTSVPVPQSGPSPVGLQVTKCDIPSDIDPESPPDSCGSCSSSSSGFFSMSPSSGTDARSPEQLVAPVVASARPSPALGAPATGSPSQPTATAKMAPSPESTVVRVDSALERSPDGNFTHEEGEEEGGTVKPDQTVSGAAAAAAISKKPASAGKPGASYIEMIARALLTVKPHRMILTDIYAYIMAQYPYYQTAPGTWRNAVRHNLCVNDCFVKAGRSNSGRGFFWAIHDACVDMFAKGDFRRVQARRLAQQMNNVKLPARPAAAAAAPSTLHYMSQPPTNSFMNPSSVSGQRFTAARNPVATPSGTLCYPGSPYGGGQYMYSTAQTAFHRNPSFQRTQPNYCSDQTYAEYCSQASLRYHPTSTSMDVQSLYSMPTYR